MIQFYSKKKNNITEFLTYSGVNPTTTGGLYEYRKS